MDEFEIKEQSLSAKPSPKKSNITLQGTINLGEYDPKSTHIQWQLIRKALDIRRKQLLTQWAELNNVLDVSKKPHIQIAMKNVERQLKKLMEDREKLYVEFSNKM